MKSLEKNKGTLIAIVVFVLVIVVYNTFLKPGQITLPSEAEAVSVGDDLLKMADQIMSVNIDKSLFNDPNYVYLTDFSAEIPQDPVGRPNPFNVIGRD
jgi:hypothetical protein